MSATARQRSILGDFLLARREALDLKPHEVAERCKKLPSWYRNIERGARATIKLEELAALEKALELTADSLVKRAREAGF